MAWILVVVAAVLIGRGHLDLTLAAFGGLALVCYLVSLLLHPNRRCRACKGTGRQRGAMFTWGDRLCSTCGGQSRHRRWGAQAFYGTTGRRTLAEQRSRQARNRRGALRG
jgi:hypothetical protein